MQVVMKMSDRAGVMSGIMFSMKHGLGKQFFMPPECKMQSETYWGMLENEYAPQLGFWYGSAGWCTVAHFETYSIWINQPPSSPNLNVLDWSIWSQIQDRMAEKHDSVLAVKVMRATEELRAQMDMDGIRREFVRRLFGCIAVRGGHALSWLIVQRKPWQRQASLMREWKKRTRELTTTTTSTSPIELLFLTTISKSY